ncbi:MAG: tetratricopeptide repeat protein, partial [Rhodoferax sp.]|nr:tetratricopeptide repeat protein [Rhodoferax sp.]
MTDNAAFTTLMEQGSRLHAAGQAEQALAQFEKALAAQPDNVDAANACATVLTQLGKP